MANKVTIVKVMEAYLPEHSEGRSIVADKEESTQTFLKVFGDWTIDSQKTEEYEEFAQVLCSEFRHWKTPAEETAEHNEQFLACYFGKLPVDVILAIRTKVWETINREVLQKHSYSMLVSHLTRLREP